MRSRVFSSIVLFAFLLAGTNSFAVSPGHDPDAFVVATAADSYFRTELYFGRSIPGGGMVLEAEWEKFLADVVTPRFPDGFTILKATGQYREKDGTIDKEPSEVLLFFYPPSKRTSSRRKIEEIRRAYVKEFKQESVLRLDYPTSVRVSF